MNTLKVGDKAPNFETKDNQGIVRKLTDYVGKKLDDKEMDRKVELMRQQDENVSRISNTKNKFFMIVDLS